MVNTLYPNFKQSLFLLFITLFTFGMFLFFFLSLPQILGIKLTQLYYSCINTISPILWIPIILFVQNKSGIPLKLTINLPDWKIMILLTILAISANILTTPFYGIIQFINNLTIGRLKFDELYIMNITLITVIKFVGLVLLVPICEEIFWRKQILGLLLRKFSPVISIGLSSILFALFHFKFGNIIALIIWAVLFGAVFYWTNSINASIFLHSLCNLMDFFTIHTFVNITKFQIFKFALMFLASSVVIVTIMKYLDRFHSKKKS